MTVCFTLSKNHYISSCDVTPAKDELTFSFCPAHRHSACCDVYHVWAMQDLEASAGGRSGILSWTDY